MVIPWSQVKELHLEQPAAGSVLGVGLQKSFSGCSPGHGEFCSHQYLDLFSFSKSPQSWKMGEVFLSRWTIWLAAA